MFKSFFFFLETNTSENTFPLSQYLYIIIPVFIVFVLFIVIVLSLKKVPQGEEWTLEQFGRFVKIMKPGLNFMFPMVQQVGYRISVKEQVLDIPPQDVISLDNAIVGVDGVVFYKVFNAQKAAYMIQNLNFAITQLVMTNIRTVLGEMELDAMLSNREVINEKLLKVVDEATDPWGVHVLRIEIKDIKPPHDLQKAMSRQMEAERTKRALILQAQGERDAAILKANGVKESTVLEAEGHKQSVILNAEANKEQAILESLARERKAEAEANAIQMVSQALKKGDLKAANYFLSERYIQSLAKMASADNSKTIFMPFQALETVGGLGSLTELVKDMMGKEKKK